MHSDDLESVCVGTAVRLRVSRRGLIPQEVSSMVSEEARVLTRYPWSYTVKNEQELARDVDQGFLPSAFVGTQSSKDVGGKKLALMEQLHQVSLS